MLSPTDITMLEEFGGGGGTSSGATAVPWITLTDAANHDSDACEAHALNFPDTRHWQEDLTKLPAEDMPYATILGASPVCPPFTAASGVTRDFDQRNAQLELLPGAPEDEKTLAKREKYKRGRLLMQEPIKYLRAMKRRYGRPVLGGVIENVVPARLWIEWDRWIGEFHQEDYFTKVIAYNSMHADAPVSERAAQSRNRLYVAFWHKSLGRHPDFDKWLRPKAYCPVCDRTVDAMQVFKKPGADMGCYGSQYTYRCPSITCRNREVFPQVMPALSALDPSIPGTRIGDRERLGMPAMAEATFGRIEAGVRKYWLPILAGADPGGFTLAPFITPMRGGGDTDRARSVFDPAHTVTAGGFHHGLALPPLVMRNYTARPGADASMTTPASQPVGALTTSGNQSLIWTSQLLVPYYGNTDSARPAGAPVGALTTRDRYGLLTMPERADQPVGTLPAKDKAGNLVVHPLEWFGGQFTLADIQFRMLQTGEIHKLMAFPTTYRMPDHFTRGTMLRLYGNACTPPVMELLYSALAECIAGQTLSRDRFELVG